LQSATDVPVSFVKVSMAVSASSAVEPQTCMSTRADDGAFCGQSHFDLTQELGEYVTTAPAPPAGAAANVCRHCQVRGKVTTKTTKVKRGTSGGKATGAVLTIGLSMLASRLSHKEKMTHYRCGNCKVVWLS
jgi:hypothetical protein